MPRAAPAAPDDIAAANGDGVAHHRVCQLSRRIRRRHALDDVAANRAARAGDATAWAASDGERGCAVDERARARSQK
jgi:hypothetical protein